MEIHSFTCFSWTEKKRILSIDLVNNDGNTPVHLAFYNLTHFDIQDRNICSVLSILLSQNNIVLKNNKHKTPLQILLSKCKSAKMAVYILVQVLNLIIVKGENSKSVLQIWMTDTRVDKVHNNGNTLLHSFLQQTPFKNSENDMNIISVLCSPNNINIQNRDGMTPLHMILHKARLFDNDGYVERIIPMFTSLDNINLQDESGMTVLHVVVQHERCDPESTTTLNIISKIVSQVNVNTQDKNGQTPLHVVLSKKSFSFTSFNCYALHQFLCKLISTANVDIKDKNGFTPLHLFLKNINILNRHSLNTVLCLISHKNIRTIDANGNTALHIIATTHNSLNILVRNKTQNSRQ